MVLSSRDVDQWNIVNYLQHHVINADEVVDNCGSFWFNLDDIVNQSHDLIVGYSRSRLRTHIGAEIDWFAVVNMENDDGTVEIKALEVHYLQRGKGFGRIAVATVEEYIVNKYNQGNIILDGRVIVNPVKEAVVFWKKMGYRVPIKSLSLHKCDGSLEKIVL